MSVARNAPGAASDFSILVEKVCTLVHKISGNRMGEKQAHMVETKLKKRMMELGIKAPNAYLKYLSDNLETESSVLVGLITTHHTFFFREFPQFELLKDKLPFLVEEIKKRKERVLNIWSAACSKGHEVYSLAMFLDYYLPKLDPNITFKILGTDIDQGSIRIAQNGVYHQTEIKEIPMMFIGNNWANGTGDIALYAKIKNNLRSKCEFRVGNLLSINETVKNEKFDIVFCRNVFIYFETYQIEAMVSDLMSRLKPNGIFFTGISEPLSGMKVDAQMIGPSTYCFKNSEVEKTAIKIPASSNVLELKEKVPAAMQQLFVPPVLKVICVDDSSSILSLLKKVLTLENGFEIVSTAVNGIEAIKKSKEVKFDLMTLDIHMPGMDGITYLEKNYNGKHPPVMIISSASRADADTAVKAIKLGACDYVEKPALSNLEDRGEEIRTKLRSIYIAAQRGQNVISYEFDNTKKFIISTPEDKLRIMFGSFSCLFMMKKFFDEIDKTQPPTIIFFEGQSEILEKMVEERSKYFTRAIKNFDNIDMKLEVNKIYFADYKKMYMQVLQKYQKRSTSILVYGNVSNHTSNGIKEWIGADLLIEDLGKSENLKSSLRELATDVVPATSFPYMSCRYLSSK